jgi:hypothetical protein
MKRKFIALCENLPQLTAVNDYAYSNVATITVTIATLEEENGMTSPRNWLRHSDDPKNSVGGCYCRMFGSTLAGAPVVHFSHFGPDIRFGAERDYQHALRALRRVQKGMDARYREFGPAEDAGASLDRWLCACGLKGKCVWTRPERNLEPTGWLNRGEWEQLTITEFVARVVEKFPKKVD